jgi:SAM-dependent MidA family methyltransferase
VSGNAEASPSLLAAIRRAIDASGPMTFAEFMELALYGSGGFYETPPVGPGGDFVTSPHVHPVFGELLARAVRELWVGLDTPAPLRLTEVGAGDGTFASSFLIDAGEIPIRYSAVERSAGARSALASIGGIEVGDRMSGPVDLVLANELLDNLPFRILRGGHEVRIGWEDDRPIEVLASADAALRGFVSDAAERIIPTGAFAFIDELAAALERGYALLIDYGGHGTSGGPAHGYRGHTVIEDVLAAPGTADITAGVDFDLITTHAEALGLTAFPTVTQRDALLALGLADWLADELRRQHLALDARAGREAVATWSGRGRASLLVDPGALGRLRWLLLATEGLDPPAWLTRAAATRS